MFACLLVAQYDTYNVAYTYFSLNNILFQK